jgi:AcrR family transcriptional regulator
MNAGKTSPQRSSLLDAAEELIREEGADGWSLQDLADRSGVDVDAVKADFESEWQAFCLVVRRDEERFERLVRGSGAAAASERIVGLLEACVPDFDWTFWIELWSLALRDERARDLRADLDERFRGLVEEMVKEGVEAGEFAVADTRMAALTIATLIDAMALQATLGDTTIRPNYMLDACVMVSGALLGAPLKLPKLEGAGDV